MVSNIADGHGNRCTGMRNACIITLLLLLLIIAVTMITCVVIVIIVAFMILLMFLLLNNKLIVVTISEANSIGGIPIGVVAVLVAVLRFVVAIDITTADVGNKLTSVLSLTLSIIPNFLAVIAITLTIITIVTMSVS